jgi:hypothetical protein
MIIKSLQRCGILNSVNSCKNVAHDDDDDDDDDDNDDDDDINLEGSNSSS